MEIKELLQNPLLDLPKSRTKKDEDLSFPNYVNSKLNVYIELISKLDNFTIIDSDNFMGIKHNDLILHLVKRLATGINTSIRNYYNGYPQKAYDELIKVFEKSSNPIENIKGYLSIRRLKQEQNLFRMREKESGKTFEKNDLFHVPYQMREIISAKRFSISGFPSLYLSNSIYTCSQELDTSTISGYSTSRFSLNSDFCTWEFLLLDLSNQTLGIRNKYIVGNSKIDGLVMRFLVTWPLIFASSIDVNKRDKPFIPEYIIPQLILIWIRTNGDDLSGVKYSSSRIPAANANFEGDFYNIVVPCKDVSPTGYCSFLGRLFKFSEPINDIPEEIERNKDDFDIKHIDIDGVKTAFSDTEYSKLEKKAIQENVTLL